MPDTFVYTRGLCGPSPAIYFGGVEDKIWCKDKIIIKFDLKPGEEKLSFNQLMQLYPCPDEPCEYCGDGKFTGLPSNACENCMNTGLKYPKAK